MKDMIIGVDFAKCAFQVHGAAGPAQVLFRSCAHVMRPFFEKPRVISSRGLNVSGAGCKSR